MKLNINTYLFEFDDVLDISIKSDVVFVDTKEDFHRIHYSDESEIRDAINWLKFRNLNRDDIRQAIDLLILTCNYFVNTSTQCHGCPLFKTQCILTDIPINWRE